MRLWIVDDDELFRNLMAFVLKEEGYEVAVFQDAASALAALPNDFPPDMVLLDIGLPGEEGEEVCRALSNAPGVGSPVLVIALIGQGDLIDRYRALAIGADDFLTKPVDNLELVMRIRNKHRRCATAFTMPPRRYLEVGAIVLDVSNHIVTIGERHAALTPCEYSIFSYLLEQPGRAFPTETLLVDALGYPPRLGNPDILRTHVRKIRRKIEVDATDPRILVNLPRVGYMVAAEMAQ